jgi:tRNA pseudouridine38-40 synthase
VNGSGRTDAGVHARAQVANFFTNSNIPVERWCSAINSHLPADIIVWDAQEADLSFDARKSAKRKTYCYTINLQRFPDPLRRHMDLHHPAPLDISAMNEALQCILGEHDFTSFSSTRNSKHNRIRMIHDVKLEFLKPGIIHIYITGNGFLYQMVRIIVGTLLMIGQGKRLPQEMRQILLARDRQQAGPTAKPHGLLLWEVSYESS